MATKVTSVFITQEVAAAKPGKHPAAASTQAEHIHSAGHWHVFHHKASHTAVATHGKQVHVFSGRNAHAKAKAFAESAHNSSKPKNKPPAAAGRHPDHDKHVKALAAAHKHIAGTSGVNGSQHVKPIVDAIAKDKTLKREHLHAILHDRRLQGHSALAFGGRASKKKMLAAIHTSATDAAAGRNKAEGAKKTKLW